MSLERTKSVTSKAEEAEIGFSKPKGISGSDEDFGGTEERKKMERKLLMKLDARMSILIVIYILNYVCPILSIAVEQTLNCNRSTGTTPVLHASVDLSLISTSYGSNSPRF